MTVPPARELPLTLLHTGWWADALTILRVFPDTAVDIQAVVLSFTGRHQETVQLIADGKVNAAVASVAIAYNALRDDDLQTAVEASRHAAGSWSEHATLATLLLALALHHQGESLAALTTAERVQDRLRTPLEQCLYGVVAWGAHAERGEYENAEAHLAVLGQQLEQVNHGPDISLTFTLALLRYADEVNPDEITDAIRHAAELGDSLAALVHGSWMAEHLAKREGLQELRDFLKNMNGFLRDSPNFRAHVGIAMVQGGALEEGEELLRELEEEARKQHLGVLPRVRLHLALSRSLQRPNDPKGRALILQTLLDVAKSYPRNALIHDIRHLTGQYVHTDHASLIPRSLRMHIPHAVTRRVKIRTLDKEEVYYGEEPAKFGKRTYVAVRLLAALKIAARQGLLLDTGNLIHEVFGVHPDQMTEEEATRARGDIVSAVHLARKQFGEHLIVHEAENGRGSHGHYALCEGEIVVDFDLFEAERMLRHRQMSRAGRVLQRSVFGGELVGPVLSEYHMGLNELYLEKIREEQLTAREAAQAVTAVARMQMNSGTGVYSANARAFILEMNSEK